MPVVDRPIELDELVGDRTLLDDEHTLVVGKRGAGQQLGFAVLMKFYNRHARFPRGRAELPDEAIRFLATN